MTGLQHKCRKQLDYTNATSPLFLKTWKVLSTSDLQLHCGVCESVLRAQLLSSPGANSLVLQENLLGDSSLFQVTALSSKAVIMVHTFSFCPLVCYSLIHVYTKNSKVMTKILQQSLQRFQKIEIKFNCSPSCIVLILPPS